jgi:hypothetical protein
MADIQVQRAATGAGFGALMGAISGRRLGTPGLAIAAGGLGATGIAAHIAAAKTENPLVGLGVGVAGGATAMIGAGLVAGIRSPMPLVICGALGVMGGMTASMMGRPTNI